MWKLIESGQMPQGGKLTTAEKQLIKSYIQYGRFPQATAETEEAARARETAKVTQADRQWWSFRKPVKSPVPSVAAKEQVRTPIDAFVLAQLEHKGWKMQSEADRPTLIRRAYFDLIGLPPTPAEVKAFVDDRSPNAWKKSSTICSPPRTTANSGDATGSTWPATRTPAATPATAIASLWKYRDYVIHALNRNKPINQFILEQLAGDQLVNYKHLAIPTPDQIEPLTATGFMRTTADITDNQTIYEVDKYFDAQQKAMETSLTALMGVTIQCARCHDHKFDPFLQRDYYKLMAIYQPVWDPENWLPADLNHGPWPSRMVLDMDEATRAAWIKDVTSNDAKALRRMDDLLEATYQKYRGELRAGRDISNEATRLQMRKNIEADPDLEVDRNAAKDVITDQEMEKRYPELAKWKDEIQLKRYERRNQSKVPPNYIEASWDTSKTPSPTHILARGNYLSPGAEVQPGLPPALDNPQHPLEFPDATKHPEWSGTNRRLTLAKWMVSPENPLVPRVFVNRVWGWHFGEGIVRSVNDFGAQGAKPTHPELLDYLTVSFVEHNWDLKWLTKEIMMSQVYRQGSAEVASVPGR